jgi:hypothetical protein
MWTNRQFWLDSSWRAFRTFCQTLAGLLAAQFSGLLSATGVTNSGIPHTPWAGFLYASATAGLISLLQAVDRERAVIGSSTAAALPAAPPYSDSVYVDPTPTTPLLPETASAPAGHSLFGESLR